ncbi:ParB/RepB/Spo0J family partition protein [Streptomyces sp. NPDC004129]|uniref:ParB/RepB/Spo0J family partition protein n=1 Tax=Streptomyces sp. NPDC004533 TaxID=3154278 RepID=UPI0033AFFB33
MTITTLLIDQIHRNERQPREYFEPNALQELADSIKRFGLMQPIEVRKDGDAGYEIVAGERRWRAHQIAELTEIKCIVTADDLTEIERFKRSVAENINRADMTPMEEAKAFRRILDEQEGAEAKDVANEFGKSLQYARSARRPPSRSPRSPPATRPQSSRSGPRAPSPATTSWSTSRTRSSSSRARSSR